MRAHVVLIAIIATTMAAQKSKPTVYISSIGGITASPSPSQPSPAPARRSTTRRSRWRTNSPRTAPRSRSTSRTTNPRRGESEWKSTTLACPGSPCCSRKCFRKYRRMVPSNLCEGYRAGRTVILASSESRYGPANKSAFSYRLTDAPLSLVFQQVEIRFPEPRATA